MDLKSLHSMLKISSNYEGILDISQKLLSWGRGVIKSHSKSLWRASPRWRVWL